jgi:hypothetical protein
VLEAAVTLDVVEIESLIASTVEASLKTTPTPAPDIVMSPVIVPPAFGKAALARSYALLTAVLDAIVVLEVVEVESETLDCKLRGVTARVPSRPA